MDGWTMDKWINGWRHGEMDGWMVKRMERWMDEG